MFNKNPLFPNQASWTIFSRSNVVIMKVISALRMQHFEMGEWLQLKKAGQHVGKIGVTLSDLWEWSLGYRMPRTSSKLGASQALQLVYARAGMVEENNLQLAQSLRRSWQLARRSLNLIHGRFALSCCGISFIGQIDCHANGQERPRDCYNCNLFFLTIADREYTSCKSCEAPNSLLVCGILYPRLHSQRSEKGTLIIPTCFPAFLS